MKAYKGFNKDMTCRGFQFAEGKTYTEDKAEMCVSGFHACENPLDCFSYYNPGSSVYHEVELEEVAGEKDHSLDFDDTKRCGKVIKIGAALDVAGICKAHFEYVKSRTTNDEQGKDRVNLAAQDWSSLAAQDGSSLAARNWSSLAAQDWSSLAARNGSSLAAQDWSSLAAQEGSSLAARNRSSLAAQDWSSLAAQDWSSLAAQDRSSLAARNGSSLAAQDRSSLAAQDGSSLAAQDRSSLAAQDGSSLAARNGSSLAAQDRSSLTAGKDSILAAFNSKAKAGLGSIIALAIREWEDGRYVIKDFAAGVVDGEKIKADTWYTVKDGQFVEVGK